MCIFTTVVTEVVKTALYKDGDVVKSLIVKSSVMPLTLLVGVRVDLNIKK
jgi:hypothetical protein